MAILLGLASAFTYGVADFFGGLASRRNPVLRVVLVSQAFGFALLLATVPVVGVEGLTGRAVVWGGLSGLAGSVGIAFLYRGLSRGRMSVVAPVTAVTGALVPVAIGLALGERPSGLEVSGVAVAIVAVVLVPSGQGPLRDPRLGRRPLRDLLSGSGLADAVAAGLGIGGFYVLLDRSGDATGLWPLVAARVVSIAVFSILVAVARESLRPVPGTTRTVLAAGGLDVTANVFYLLAARLGLLSIVPVIASLYPAGTVVLARVILGERMGRLQLVGLAAAAVGVALIAAG